MDAPTNEEGYTAPKQTIGDIRDSDPVKFEEHTLHTCCQHDSMVLRLQNLQMEQQKLEFTLREVKDSQSRMMWKLVAVIGATSFICGWLGVHSWVGVLIG